MGTDGRYVFPPGRRAAYEMLLAPLGVYQYVGGKVVTLLVSDGLCQFQGETREVLTDHFNNRMFEKVHPDDVQNLAQMAYKFAIQIGKYDAVYRSRLYGRDEYRYVHAISKYHVMEDGKQVAFTHYEDITETLHSLVENARNIEAPLTQFLNENASAMVIADSRTEHLYYYNKAACRMLQPQVIFDSGMTFQQFFYHDIPGGIVGLFSAADMGIHIVEEPRTHRSLETMVVSTTWEKEEAYAVYFYEHPESARGEQKVDLRHQRLAFQHTMFSGASNDLKFWQDGYRGFRVWNLTKNTLAADAGYNHLKIVYGSRLTYPLYLQSVLAAVPRPEERQILEKLTRENLMYSYETGGYPRTTRFRLETNHGHVEMQTSFVLMRSPGDHDLYLKVTEENISQRSLIEDMFHRAVEKEYDYVAYFDGKANTCRIISSFATSQDQWDRLISIEDYLANFVEHLEKAIHSVEDFLAYVAECCKGKQEHVFTYELPNQHIKRVNIQFTDRANQLFFIYRSDVTDVLLIERKRRSELEALRDEAQAADREKNMFMARMSHDLRTPMGAILSLAQFGIEESVTDGCRGYFRQILDSGQYMLGMLNDILEMQKLISGKVELLEDTICLGEIEEHVFTIVRPRAQAKQLRLTAQHHLPSGTYVRCDYRKIERILINILNNAVKYTPEAGSIQWTSHQEAEGGTIRVVHEITDTGVGISQQFQERMFEPFSQEKNLLSAQEGGTGLGLATVRKLIDAMQGEIEVQSELGKGSCFRIVLPCRAATAEQIAEYQRLHHPVSMEKQEFAGRYALVCEDNELNQMIIGKILTEAGFKVDLAENGEKGVGLVSRNHYDVVLMDVRMPVMDGLEATRRIRAANKELPIIALSANAYAEDIKKSLDTGMNAHLAKPIDIQKLLGTLHSVIGI